MYPQDNFSLLPRAVLENDIEEVQRLVQSGVDINAGSASCRSPIICAYLTRNYPMMEYLLDRGAHPCTATGDGDTALHYAAREN